MTANPSCQPTDNGEELPVLIIYLFILFIFLLKYQSPLEASLTNWGMRNSGGWIRDEDIKWFNPLVIE